MQERSDPFLHRRKVPDVVQRQPLVDNAFSNFGAHAAQRNPRPHQARTVGSLAQRHRKGVIKTGDAGQIEQHLLSASLLDLVQQQRDHRLAAFAGEGADQRQCQHPFAQRDQWQRQTSDHRVPLPDLIE